MECQTIREFLVHFERHHWKGRSIDARRGYRNSISRFAVFLQRDPELADLNPDTLEACDRWLQMQVAKTTRKSTIGKLRTIWRAAHSDGLIAFGPPVVSQSQCGVPTFSSVGSSMRVFKIFSEAELNAVHDPEKPPATLREFVSRYAAERGIRVRSVDSIYQRLTNFEKMLGRPAKFTDLNDTTMNLWTSKLFEAGLRPVTVRGYRGIALALWRAAYELHFVETRPGRIRKFKVIPSVPQCWTEGQLVEVTQAFRRLHGQMQSDPTIRRAAFWTAFVLVGYYSALRLGDLESLRWDQVQDGLILLTWDTDRGALQSHPDGTVNEPQNRSSVSPSFGSLAHNSAARRLNSWMTPKASQE